MNILIIGASSGIGREVSLLFLRNGHRVAMCARRIEPLEEIRRQFPYKSFVKQIDVNDCWNRVAKQGFGFRKRIADGRNEC